MRTAHLLTFAIGVFACSYSQSDSLVGRKDSTVRKNLSQHTSKPSVVSRKKATASGAPELPFFKDMLNSRLLFW